MNAEQERRVVRLTALAAVPEAPRSVPAPMSGGSAPESQEGLTTHIQTLQVGKLKKAVCYKYIRRLLFFFFFFWTGLMM